MAAAEAEFSNKAKVLKGRIVSLNSKMKSVVEQGRLSSTDSAQLPLFKAMYDEIFEYRNQLNQCNDSLIELYIFAGKDSEYPDTQSKLLLTSSERYFFECKMLFTKLVSEAGSTVNVSTGNLTLNESKVTRGRLPKIKLPHFDGNVLEWPHFRDVYFTLVHTDENISNIEKFYYLVGALSGEALTLVKHIQLSETNYPTAWETLDRRYNNPRLLATNYLKQLWDFKPPTGKPTLANLRNFLNYVVCSVTSFKLLKLPDEAGFILFNLAIRSLDPVTREAFEKEHAQDQFPTFDQLKEFVINQCKIMELTNTSDSNSFNSKSSINSVGSKPRTSLMLTRRSNRVTSKPMCFLCDEHHYLTQCSTFKEMSPKQRYDSLKHYKGCRYHLTPTHSTQSCKFKVRCNKCQKQHNTLLHFEPFTLSQEAMSPSEENPKLMENNENSSSSKTSSKTLLSSSNSIRTEVLLETAIVLIADSQNNYHPIRLVIDSGSQCSLITKECARKLGLTIEASRRTLAGVGKIQTKGEGRVNCTLKPRQANYPVLTTKATVVHSITGNIPSINVPPDIWTKFKVYDLADPQFYQARTVEFLLGADLYPAILRGGSTFIDNSETGMIDTVFGWTISGRYRSPHKVSSSLAFITTIDPVDVLLRKFWEIEEPSEVDIKNPEDQLGEEHFVQTHYRTDKGQYVVSLPFKGQRPFLQSSKSIALKRFLNLEQKLNKDPLLKEEYGLFLKEYEQLGHMVPATVPGRNWIPHHCVIKADSSTTKLRVVFDASAKTEKGSLNDHLLIGPKLQRDISDILINFRLHKVAFTADISKMYRQILLDSKDRVYQHIFWRTKPEEDVKEYELCTVTYGLSASPFLALRVIKQLIKDEGNTYPHASQVLGTDIYIDDIVTGAQSVPEAIALQEEIIALLAKGGFSLRKWVSNSKEILERVPKDHLEKPIPLTPKDDFIVKILGLQWDPKTDCLSYKVSLPTIGFTKRSVLSTIARIYDPLGYLSPVVFYAKSIMQEIWKAGCNWDEPIPPDLENKWKEFLKQLHYVSFIKIPRFISLKAVNCVCVLGFCDASEIGYAAAVYLWKRFTDERVEVQLIKAKTRLAPLKTMTIPRLELSSALLLANIYTSLGPFLSKIDVTEKIFFSDSTVVLGWLNTAPHRLHIFVANRVIQILEKTKAVKWCHIKSAENPADLASRGSMPAQFSQTKLWWQGPEWLYEPFPLWPIEASHSGENESLPELKPLKNVLVNLKIFSQWDISWMDKYSSFPKLLRIVAYMLRFVYNCKNKENKHIGVLLAVELHKAEEICLKAIQGHHFKNEIRPDNTFISDRLTRLSPFYDEAGLLRVGGRLKNMDIDWSIKHPILLPSHNHLTNLIVDYYHKISLHGGLQLTLSFVRQKFWLLSGRKLVKQRIFKCHRCYRLKLNPKAPPMGNLPKERSESGHAFLNVGVDYAGPFLIKESSRRKAPISKAYLCIFVCFSTKAVHLEAVSNLTTDAFIACLERFISRRGLPKRLFSDQGTNFIGAARKLKELYKALNRSQQQEKLIEISASKGIEWNFNPPSSPNFGGLWEAGVKSVKHHLSRVTNETPFTYEELSTLLTKIEAILNSRPLYPLTSDPNDLEFLTPGHFLIGKNLTAAPERDWLDTKEHYLTRWHLVQQRSQHFWKRWSMEYLHQLQPKSKWFKGDYYGPKEGDLVIICDKNQPPLQWQSARVLELHPGNDSIVRVVTLQTSSGKLKRPVSKIVPLLPSP